MVACAERHRPAVTLGTAALVPGQHPELTQQRPGRETAMEPSVSAQVSTHPGPSPADTAIMPAQACRRFLDQAIQVHAVGLKSYGLLIAEPDVPGYPFAATDVVFLDSRRNRRNEAGNRAAFEAQGDYFRRHDDAGFVADPTDLLAAYRRIEDSGREIVAVFHSHRRQPANFSWIDFRLHNPAFAWHLIISFHAGPIPQLQPFRVDKPGLEVGIGAHDDRDGSELAYPGPEVVPLSLRIEGTPAEVAVCAGALGLGAQHAAIPKAGAHPALLVGSGSRSRV
jgi:proteasome lid subunit RPN8/RPN11